jgi:hypothetical protein
MTDFQVPARVAANIARRHAALHSQPCTYGCRATARLYPAGWRCDLHAPWAQAGQPDPTSQVDPTRTLDALRRRMQQPDAEVRALRAQIPEPTDTITQRFLAFDAANPHVRERLVQLIEQHVSAGARRLGIGALFEQLRGHVETNGNRYQLDNTLRAPMVRALIAARPDWAGLFELRERRAS